MKLEFRTSQRPAFKWTADVLVVPADAALPFYRKGAKDRMQAGGGDKKSGTERIPDPIPNQGEAREHAAKAFGTIPRMCWRDGSIPPRRRHLWRSSPREGQNRPLSDAGAKAAHGGREAVEGPPNRP